VGGGSDAGAQCEMGSGQKNNKLKPLLILLSGVTCDKSCSAGKSLRLNIILLKDEPSLGQVLQVGGDDGGVVPGDIIVAKVICYYQDYVRLMSGLLGLD
jgi:hypothetical protein